MDAGVLILAAIFLLGLIPAAIANKKGYNFFLWWFFGMAIFVIALPLSLALKDRAATGDSLLRLEKLNELRRTGAISDAEYEKQKKQLLLT